MLDRPLVKVALLVVLGLAAFAGRPVTSPWFTVGILAFGAFNVIATVPGTKLIRASSVAATIAALVWNWLAPLLLLFAWLLWPPTFMVTWAMERDLSAITHGKAEPVEAVVTGPRLAIAAIIASVTVASIAYKLIFATGLQQTAALFVGIPALVAILVVFIASPRSAVGVACKAVTIGLLLSLVFFGEGILCVLMSAPLFYAVAIGIASTARWVHGDADRSSITLRSSLILLLLVPMSLEGVTGPTTANRHERVVATKIVDAGAEEVGRALFEQPRFRRARPLYLRAGFPSPISTRIEHASGKARWAIALRGGEMRIDGMEPRTGDLVLELDEARAGFVRWRAISDTSHMTHFLKWGEVTVQWESVAAHQTRVTWTLDYERELDPAWYFGPWERYAMRLAAGYLIDSVATP